MYVRGNIVISTIKPYIAGHLNERLDEWKGIFDEYHVESFDLPEKWVKLVAHSVPVLPEVDILSIFNQEVETFNDGIKVKGIPRWSKLSDKTLLNF